MLGDIIAGSGIAVVILGGAIKMIKDAQDSRINEVEKDNGKQWEEITKIGKSIVKTETNVKWIRRSMDKDYRDDEE